MVSVSSVASVDRFLRFPLTVFPGLVHEGFEVGVLVGEQEPTLTLPYQGGNKKVPLTRGK
jgi:hypothetical protein